MTKQEEIELFARFYRRLPADSYLKDILNGVVEDVATMIRNDWAFSLAGRVDDLYREREALKQQIKELHQKVDELTSQVRRLEYDLAAMEAARRDAARRLRNIAYLLEKEGP